MKTIHVLAIMAMLGFTGVTWAATPITISNYSFESESGAYYHPPSGWNMGGSTTEGRCGSDLAATLGLSGADGTQCAYFNYKSGSDTGLPNLYQDTGATFVEGYAYTLTVAISVRSNQSQNIIWKLSLHYADNDREIASKWGTALYADQGALGDISISNYIASAADVGKTIRVRISHASGNAQLCADNVRLSYETKTTPETVLPIHVVNWSFQEESAYPYYHTPTAWMLGGSTADGRIGEVANSTPGITGGDGLYNMYMNGRAGGDTDNISAYQNTIGTLVPGYRYSLTVAIGLPTNYLPAANMPWKLALCDAATSNEITCAQGWCFTNAAGLFRDYSLTGYVASVANSGKVIQVRIHNLTANGQLQVDNVRLIQERGNWVSISNHSFEAQLPNGGVDYYYPPPGWTMTGSSVETQAGINRSAARSLTGGQGENSAYINNWYGPFGDTNYITLYQNTDAVLAPGCKYRLTAAVAVRGDIPIDCPWKISLNDADSGAEFASTNGTITAEGAFNDFSTPFYSVTTADTGKTLQVRLINMSPVTGGTQLAMDNVRLERFPVPKGAVMLFR